MGVRKNDYATHHNLVEATKKGFRTLVQSINHINSMSLEIEEAWAKVEQKTFKKQLEYFQHQYANLIQTQMSMVHAITSLTHMMGQLLFARSNLVVPTSPNPSHSQFDTPTRISSNDVDVDGLNELDFNL